MRNKVVVIAGPTGVGKTACSIHLAKHFSGEIISGDSMQVYKELSIGTAKIKQAEMESVPHHLVDCMSFLEDYNVKTFQEKARVCIDEIRQAQRMPIVCGGTGLYIKSLLYDYEFTEQIRDQKFIDYLNGLSNEQLYKLLFHIDKEALKKIHINNRQRLVRALEMAHLGDRKSDIIEKQNHRILYDAYCIGLTCERDILYERINQRVDHMIQEGLLEEVTALYKEYEDALWNKQSMKSIGYKEWKPYFEGQLSVIDCIEAIKKNSRNFAKRQYTWFNNQMQMHWYDVTESDWLAQIVKNVEKWMKE